MKLGMVARKLLNIRDKGKSNYSSDADDFNYAEFDTEGILFLNSCLAIFYTHMHYFLF